MQHGAKKRSIILTKEDRKHLAAIKAKTGMCDSVNIRDAVKLLDDVLSGKYDIITLPGVLLRVS